MPPAASVPNRILKISISIAIAVMHLVEADAAIDDDDRIASSNRTA